MVNEIKSGVMSGQSSIEPSTDPTKKSTLHESKQLSDNTKNAEEIALSNEFMQIKTAVEQGQEIDFDKVAALKDQIKNGEFEANSTAIAKKLLDDLS